MSNLIIILINKNALSIFLGFSVSSFIETT